MSRKGPPPGIDPSARVYRALLRLYSADFERLAEIRDFFDGFWNSSLAALKERAETATTREDPR